MITVNHLYNLLLALACFFILDYAFSLLILFLLGYKIQLL